VTSNAECNTEWSLSLTLRSALDMAVWHADSLLC